MSKEKTHQRANKKPLWFRLDNAALIFPASLRKHWSNAYRISFTFKDPVELSALKEAIQAVRPRFPSVFVRLRRSFFWFYLQEIDGVVEPQMDIYQPLRGMKKQDIKKCAIRILYYKNRIAVEFFHAVTDGTGGMMFAKTLAAAYVKARYGVVVPAEYDIKDVTEPVPEEELVDSFTEAAGEVSLPRDPGNVFHLRGDLEADRFLHVTRGEIPAEALITKAKEHQVTVTAYVTAFLLKSLLEIQASRVKRLKKQKPVKVQIPVNLRQLYGSKTMRNFVAVLNVGVDPKMGDYSLEELIQIVHHQMKLGITPKHMSGIFTPNVRSAQNPFLKVVPLFLKNVIMRIVFDTVGESVATTCLSNLGEVRLPEEMKPYVTAVDFVLGPQSTAPYNVSMTGYGGKIIINIVRNTRKAELERVFFTKLVKEGLHVAIQSNAKE